QVSLPYSVAVALIDGAALFPQYQNERLADPQIVRLSNMLEVLPDDSLSRGVSCLLELTTVSGKVYRSQVDHPRGSIENPMSEAELNPKIHLLAEPSVGAEGVASLIADLEQIDSDLSVSAITKHFTVA